MNVPNFFVIGVPKAGTTSLYHYLAQHQQVYMSPIKEPTYFAAVDLLTNNRFRRRQERDRVALQAYLAGPQRHPAPLYVTEWSDYVKLFRDVRGETAIGEASGGYFWLPSAARAIRSTVPDARLIVILRNPTETLFSWYLITRGPDPNLAFRAWFLAQQRPSEDWWSPLDIGRYATHLRRYFETFPADQMRVFLYEDYQRNTRSALRDIFTFLAVDPDHLIDTSTRHNETGVPRFPWLHYVKTRLFSQRSPAGWLPAGVRRHLRRLYYRGRGSFVLDPADRRMVVEHYREEILGAAALIGRDLSAWLR